LPASDYSRAKSAPLRSLCRLVGQNALVDIVVAGKLKSDRANFDLVRDALQR